MIAKVNELFLNSDKVNIFGIHDVNRCVLIVRNLIVTLIHFRWDTRSYESNDLEEKTDK